MLSPIHKLSLIPTNKYLRFHTVKEEFLLFGALVMEQIWKRILPNQMSLVDQEYLFAFSSVSLVNPRRDDVIWVRLDHGSIMINCDAAVGSNNSFIFLVARNWGRDLVFALSTLVENNFPFQAKAETIN